MTILEAYGNSSSSDKSIKSMSARWPNRGGARNRLHPDCQPTVQPKFNFNRSDNFFAIGSCFARNIEEYLHRLGINVISRSVSFPPSELLVGSRPNDLIVKYTPPTIYQELMYAFGGEGEYARQFDYIVDLGDGKYVDLNLPTWFPPVSRERAIERRKEISTLFTKIAEAKIVIITLGLIECWQDNALGGFICDTPSPALVKKYPGRFSFLRLDYDEALHYTRETVSLVRAANESARIILTTSPVPLGRTFTGSDVIVANCYSKSVLRAVAGRLAEFDYIDYFPSYEMVVYSDFI